MLRGGGRFPDGGNDENNPVSVEGDIRFIYLEIEYIYRLKI
jgi:hypothetical protein